MARRVPIRDRLARASKGQSTISLKRVKFGRGTGIEIKKFFLDRGIIDRKIGREKAKRLRKMGFIVRQEARRSIRVVVPTRLETLKAAPGSVSPRTGRAFSPSVRARARENIKRKRFARSKPGRPPIAHTRHKTRTIRYILFYYDMNIETVICGPVWFPTEKNKNVVPQTLEFGGKAIQRSNRRTFGGRRRRDLFESSRIAARPFMNPAVKTKKDKLGKVVKGIL